MRSSTTRTHHARTTLLAIVVVVVAASAASQARDLDREWADAMIELRAEYRASLRSFLARGRSSHDRRRIAKSLTGNVCERMVARFPYRTDWLLQDNGNNLEAWLKQTGEPAIETRLLGKFGGTTKSIGDGGTDDPRWLEAYAKAAAARRAGRLANLRRQFPRIVFTKNHTIEPSFYAYTEGQSDAQRERHFRPGTALCLMEWDGVYAKTTDLIADPHGRVRDPEVSFDGKKVLFAWKKSDRLDDYHLYEVVAESGDLRQLTHGQGVADFEPCYLPNGDIVFSSSRCVQTVDCWWTEVSNLYACGPEGEHLRRLGFDQVHTSKPALLEDGRVIYTRWDYNDRGQVFPQGLFQMNPDGTGQTEFYGNNSWFPTTMTHARGIPGTSLVVATAHGHHTWQAGELVLVDVSKGRQEAAGVQLIAPVRETKAVRVDRYGQGGDLFQYPFPINAREFLVAYSPLGGRPTRFSIYYMDIDGNRELLVSDPAISCQHPMPLAARRRPAARTSVVDYTKDTGVYYMQDVYFGPGLAGVERGAIEKLRVVELEFRAAGVGSNGSRGPAGGAMSSTPISIGNGAWDVKRVVGEARVHPDGSALFEAPARKPLYFQALDKYGSAVQTMRSWSTLMPGETFSCVGCHEDKNAAPPSQSGSSLAVRAGARKLEPFHGPPRGFSFRKEIQPILDAKCVSCHDAKDAFCLTADEVHDKGAKRKWTQSYVSLTGAALGKGGRGRTLGNPDGPHCKWVSAQSAPEMIPPRSTGSAVSPMMKLLRDGHEKVKLTREELEKLACWIDLGVPFCGDYYEGNAWTANEKAFYDRYQAKREYFAALEEKSVKAMLAGRVIDDSGDRNPYRNIAMEATATSNSECRNDPVFAARNVIDGNLANEGHGKGFPSWGPDKRDDLWLKLEWPREVYLDRVVVRVRADFKPYRKNDHDSWWKNGTIEFSSGRKVPFKLAKSADPQAIEIRAKRWPPEPVRWIKFTNLVPAEDKWCGFSEVEVMGVAKRDDLPY